jgi:hypothetical protein
MSTSIPLITAIDAFGMLSLLLLLLLPLLYVRLRATGVLGEASGRSLR